MPNSLFVCHIPVTVYGNKALKYRDRACAEKYMRNVKLCEPNSVSYAATTGPCVIFKIHCDAVPVR